MTLGFDVIAGLPWTAWLLWIAAVGLGLAIELVFYFRHHHRGEDGSN